MSHLLRVDGLDIELPGGGTIASAAALTILPGTVTTLLGPSGGGKSTLLRAVFHPDEMRRAGYALRWGHRELEAQPAFVPQRGALLDHLDVGDNIALAQAAAGAEPNPSDWLAAVGLDPSMGTPGRAVGTLSGGQAQRVAVARALAAGRQLIVMDEPSVGLDPVGVRLLARQLVQQARKHGVGFIVITHDLALAAGASDQILFLDTTQRQLVPLLPDWSGPAELLESDARQARLAEVESAVEDLLLGSNAKASGVGSRHRARGDLLASFRVAGEGLLHALHPKLFRQSAVVFRHAILQALVRTIGFYGVVGGLLGFTVPYVVAHISADLRPAAVFGLIKGTHVLSLAPPLSAIVFAATSGSAASAWLGGLRLHGQVTAVEGLGVSPVRYLWSPTWLALVLSYALTSVVFTAAMIGGGAILYSLYGVASPLEVLASDFLSPPPSRYPYLARGLWLFAAYAVAIASIVVAKGQEAKTRSEDVTKSMTSAIMSTTLFVVGMELATVALLRVWWAP